MTPMTLLDVDLLSLQLVLGKGKGDRLMSLVKRNWNVDTKQLTCDCILKDRAHLMLLKLDLRRGMLLLLRLLLFHTLVLLSAVVLREIKWWVHVVL